MKISLGFSPCPNDTFIFDALVNKKIETHGLDFEIHLADVETLNLWAIEERLDVTKLSFGVFPLVKDSYTLLNSGSALGTGVGPLLISKHHLTIEEISQCRILIPGKHTTAHLLFSQAFPMAGNKQFIRYDEVENALLDSKDRFLAGVIIHENRFTFQDKGLELISDLGKYWEEKTGLPVPLGGIVAKKELDTAIISTVEKLIRESINYSWQHYPSLSSYVTSNAQEMNEDVMRKHIELYVNKYSVDLGQEGKNAVEKWLMVNC